MPVVALVRGRSLGVEEPMRVVDEVVPALARAGAVARRAAVDQRR